MDEPWINPDHQDSEVLRTAARDAATSEKELRDAVVAELYPFIRYLESLFYKESVHGFHFASSRRGCMLAREIKDMLLNDPVVCDEEQRQRSMAADRAAGLAAARDDDAFQHCLAGMLPKRPKRARRAK